MKLGFKNFRRYEEFPEFESGNITILVGGNNAGKSTLQKALLLCLDNLRHFDPQFHFDTTLLNDLNLGTFARSLHKGAKEQEMEFTISIQHFVIRVVLKPSPQGADFPSAMVALVEINDTLQRILYSFDFVAKRICARFEEIEGDGSPEFDKLQEEIKTKCKSLDEYLRGDELSRCEAHLSLIEIRGLLEERNNIIETKKKPTYSVIETKFDVISLYNLHSGLAHYIEKIAQYYFYQIGAEPPVCIIGEESPEVIQDTHRNILSDIQETHRNILSERVYLVMESAYALSHALSIAQPYYIQAHGIVQKKFHTINDKNDMVAQVIHRYVNIKNHRDTDISPDDFVRKWMNEFGIGSNYRITSLEGEGYTVEIEDGNNWINLGDLGMGANQLMVLLFNLATIIQEHGFYIKKEGRFIHPPFNIIIVEEPEQNTHPRLQSKLADLFAELAQDFRYRFIVETHSEYLIRRTQVRVAEMELSEEELEQKNPFRVYYFPSDGMPYDMQYTPSGRFENKFGEGFFDEASTSALTISKLERRRNNG